MKALTYLSIVVILILAAGAVLFVNSDRTERVVRRILGAAPELNIEKPKRISGGREPVYRCIVVLDERTKSSQFLEALGLVEVRDANRKKQITETIKHAFADEFTVGYSVEELFYSGVLNNAPYSADARVVSHSIYLVLSRY